MNGKSGEEKSFNENLHSFYVSFLSFCFIYIYVHFFLCVHTYFFYCLITHWLDFNWVADFPNRPVLLLYIEYKIKEQVLIRFVHHVVSHTENWKTAHISIKCSE